jgi:lipopolysaccharide export system protein LptA
VRVVPRARGLLLTALLVSCWSLWAADPISFSADSVQASLAKDKESTILTGKAKVKTGSISIAADRIELFGKDFVYLNCSGSVTVVDTERQIRLEAPSLYYDRTKKLARTQGPSVLQDDRNKLVLKAEWIESDGENEITLAEVAVRIIKDKLACRAEYVLYRRKENTLELSGSPSVYKDGDKYEASRMIVNTDTEDIKLEGKVKGSVSDKNASTPAAAPDVTTPAPDATTPAPDATTPASDATTPVPGAGAGGGG